MTPFTIDELCERRDVWQLDFFRRGLWRNEELVADNLNQGQFALLAFLFRNPGLHDYVDLAETLRLSHPAIAQRQAERLVAQFSGEPAPVVAEQRRCRFAASRPTGRLVPAIVVVHAMAAELDVDVMRIRAPESRRWQTLQAVEFRMVAHAMRLGDEFDIERLAPAYLRPDATIRHLVELLNQLNAKLGAAGIDWRYARADRAIRRVPREKRSAGARWRQRQRPRPLPYDAIPGDALLLPRDRYELCYFDRALLRDGGWILPELPPDEFRLLEALFRNQGGAHRPSAFAWVFGGDAGRAEEVAARLEARCRRLTPRPLLRSAAGLRFFGDSQGDRDVARRLRIRRFAVVLDPVEMSIGPIGQRAAVALEAPEYRVLVQSCAPSESPFDRRLLESVWKLTPFEDELRAVMSGLNDALAACWSPRCLVLRDDRVHIEDVRR